MLIASKTTNILSPLYIGYAVNQLTNEGEVPYYYIAMYAGLSFVSSACKEVQNVVYLYVKQTAFRQLSQYSFRHLHSLSLDWHLKKKMGTYTYIEKFPSKSV